MHEEPAKDPARICGEDLQKADRRSMKNRRRIKQALKSTAANLLSVFDIFSGIQSLNFRRLLRKVCREIVRESGRTLSPHNPNRVSVRKSWSRKCVHDEQEENKSNLVFAKFRSLAILLSFQASLQTIRLKVNALESKLNWPVWLKLGLVQSVADDTLKMIWLFIYL